MIHIETDKYCTSLTDKHINVSMLNILRWSVYAEGLPQVIKCEKPCDLPAEVQFSFTKEVEFVFTAFKQ